MIIIKNIEKREDLSRCYVVIFSRELPYEAAFSQA